VLFAKSENAVGFISAYGGSGNDLKLLLPFSLQGDRVCKVAWSLS